MFSVGLDVDSLKSVFTKKILLYAGTSYPMYNNLLMFIMLGKIYLHLKTNLIGQSAGNFRWTKKTSVLSRNVYQVYDSLPKLSDHVPKKEEVNNKQFGYFLAGLIEGDG
jgi:hypothetical protein